MTTAWRPSADRAAAMSVSIAAPAASTVTIEMAAAGRMASAHPNPPHSDVHVRKSKSRTRAHVASVTSTDCTYAIADSGAMLSTVFSIGSLAHVDQARVAAIATAPTAAQARATYASARGID